MAWKGERHQTTRRKEPDSTGSCKPALVQKVQRMPAGEFAQKAEEGTAPGCSSARAASRYQWRSPAGNSHAKRSLKDSAQTRAGNVARPQEKTEGAAPRQREAAFLSTKRKENGQF